MRKLTIKTLRKRGCAYCTNYKIKEDKSKKVHKYCKLDVCPYNELNEYNNFSAYLKAHPYPDIVELLRRK